MLVFIRRTLTGKLAVGGQNFIYNAQNFIYSAQKLSKSGRFQKSATFEGFWTFSHYRTK